MNRAFTAVTFRSHQLVASLREDAADEVGLQPRDVIVLIQEKTDNIFRDFFNALEAHRAGVAAEVELIRQGDGRSMEITLG